MKRMWDKKKLIELIKEQGGGGELTPTALMNILKGTDYISVDLSEDEKSVQVEFDFTAIEDFNKELGLNQFIIAANVDMSSDPLNPEVEITSDNIFDDLKAYIIAHHKMPFITIKYTIGDDVYYSFVKTFRISYAYGSIDGFLLYTDWSEITGIGEEDAQSVMLKVELDDDNQSGNAKIRFLRNPTRLYEHTIKFKCTESGDSEYTIRLVNTSKDRVLPPLSGVVPLYAVYCVRIDSDNNVYHKYFDHERLTGNTYDFYYFDTTDLAIKKERFTSVQLVSDDVHQYGGN